MKNSFLNIREAVLDVERDETRINPVAFKSEKSDILDSGSGAGKGCDWNILLPQKEGSAQLTNKFNFKILAADMSEDIVCSWKELSLAKVSTILTSK